MKKKKEEKIVCERIPIVTILGHVDHGKTTILDKIRESNVQSCEAGGITQKISVFTIKPDSEKDERITFIDTPGHEAFDLMRLRGGNIADITLLIVAANDGIQPQTKESIEIIKNSTTKPVVVINKIDLPDTNIDKIKRDLANEGIQLEDMGGDIPYVKVSGKTGEGIKELLDMINLVVDVEGLTDKGTLPDKVLAKAVVLESIKEKSRGNVSTIVVTNGCFSKGEFIGYFVDGKPYVEKVKALISEDGKDMGDFDTGSGGKIIGLSNLLDLGSEVYVLEENDKKILNSVIKSKKDEDTIGVSEETDEIVSFFEDNNDQEDEDIKEIAVILKSSSEGSLEALRNSLENLDIEGARINIISDGVGDISMKDIERAEVAKAIILGFEVGYENGVEDLAKKKKIIVRTYEIIYKLIEEMSDALNMLVMPEETEEEIGKSVIKEIFILSNGKKVLGSRVESGKMKRDCKVYIVRDDEILSESKIKSLKINKNDVIEATKGMDCGIIVDSDVEAEPGDEIYCYKIVK